MLCCGGSLSSQFVHTGIPTILPFQFCTGFAHWLLVTISTSGCALSIVSKNHVSASDNRIRVPKRLKAHLRGYIEPPALPLFVEPPAAILVPMMRVPSYVLHLSHIAIAIVNIWLGVQGKVGNCMMSSVIGNEAEQSGSNTSITMQEGEPANVGGSCCSCCEDPCTKKDCKCCAPKK